MKKQQLSMGFGKKLTNQDMKKVQGGWLTTGLWVCTADYFDCYTYKGECLTYCSKPTSCRWYPYCP
jgi:hypothetical protein